MSNTDVFVHKSSFVKFIPEINSKLKCTNSSIMVGQLEYWFSKYKDGFYKFMEPCDHFHYREGDSWTEELSLTRKVLNKAFDLVGVRYKSKSAYDAAEDTFQGKLYASYYDRSQNKTFYVRNYQIEGDLRGFLKSFLKNIVAPKKESSNSVSGSSNKRPLRNGPLGRSPIYKDTTKTINTPTPPKSPSNETLDKDFEKREGEVLNLKTNKKEKFQSEVPFEPTLSADKWEEANKMYDIWVDKTENLIPTPSLSHKMAVNLLDSLQESFSGSFTLWEAYCRRVRSSKFLTGQTGGKFKLWLVKALQPDMIEKVRGGEYGVDATIELYCPEEKQALEAQEAKERQALEREISSQAESEEESEFRIALLKKVGLKAYKSWFKDLTARKREGGFEICCISPFKRDWIEQNHKSTFEKLSQKLGIEFLKVVVL